jgi:hypothetical protein
MSPLSKPDANGIGSIDDDSPARPGGNATGIANYIPELSRNRLELIAEVVPGARRIAMQFNPLNSISTPTIRPKSGPTWPISGRKSSPKKLRERVITPVY